MKKILLGSSALIAAGFFAYTASAEVEFNLTGSVSGKAAYGSMNLDIKDTYLVNNKATLINTKDQVFKDTSGQENVNFSVWTEGSLKGELSTVSASGITYKGHFRIFDGGSGRADIYVSAGGSFGTVFIGDRNFSSEIMKVGGTNYDIDADVGVTTGGLDAYVAGRIAAGAPAGTIANDYIVAFAEPFGDTDLANGTVNRLMYISPNLLGSDNDTGLHIGGYVALSNDQTSNYDHEWTANRALSDRMVYGAGFSFETALSETSSVLVDASFQTIKSDFQDLDSSSDTMLYRLGAQYTMGDWVIKGFWDYVERDVNAANWTEPGTAGAANASPTAGQLFSAARQATTHTFDIGVEYTMGAFTYGMDAMYSTADLDAYKGTPGKAGVAGPPIVSAVNGSLDKITDKNNTSDYVGIGAGVSIELVEDVTFTAIKATYVRGNYTAVDGSLDDILGVAGEDMDYSFSYVSVSTGLEIEF